MKLVIFEDSTFANFYPLSLIRPVFELRCGATSLAEKLRRRFPGLPTAYFTRDDLAASVRSRAGNESINDLAALDDDLLLLNGRWLCLDTPLQAQGPEEVGLEGGHVVYGRVQKATVRRLAPADFSSFLRQVSETLPRRAVEVTLLSYPWNLVHHNPEAIRADFKALGKAGLHGKVHPLSCVYGEESMVYVASSAVVHPMVVLDSTGGPILIEEGVKVFPHTRIEGPAFIGRDTQIVGGKIREGCSIGPVCRVGGEVEESIIHGYSNKYHDGFLGHAYVGEWVNLGALTTNSDLKNDYSTVEVKLNGQSIDTGGTKVGSFIGDHTKTSIGTLFNTGTVVGMMTNILGGSGILPKVIPSFCLFANNRALKGFGLRSLLQTAETAMGRRKVRMTEDDRAVLAHAYEITRPERDEAIRKSRREILQG
ncbi:MAG: hypothetical protein HYU36_17220 [Planctomycetes bacterium]|nr:hypothetical protein [Planctomycetota bacterium]